MQKRKTDSIKPTATIQGGLAFYAACQIVDFLKCSKLYTGTKVWKD